MKKWGKRAIFRLKKLTKHLIKCANTSLWEPLNKLRSVEFIAQWHQKVLMATSNFCHLNNWWDIFCNGHSMVAYHIWGTILVYSKNIVIFFMNFMKYVAVTKCHNQVWLKIQIQKFLFALYNPENFRLTVRSSIELIVWFKSLEDEN